MLELAAFGSVVIKASVTLPEGNVAAPESAIELECSALFYKGLARGSIHREFIFARLAVASGGRADKIIERHRFAEYRARFVFLQFFWPKIPDEAFYPGNVVRPPWEVGKFLCEVQIQHIAPFQGPFQPHG